jgi:hypothetical protein
MIPLDVCPIIIGKESISDESGLIILGDHEVSLTSDEFYLANRYLDSFMLYNSAYLNAQRTTTMAEQATQEDEWECR